MYENELRRTTPAAARQTNPTRRGLLALTQLAAMAAVAPGVTLGQLQQEKGLIANCGEIIAIERYLWKVLPACFPESQEEALEAAQAPFAARQIRLIKQICAAKAITLDGCRAKARALAAWAPDMVADDEGIAVSEFLNNRMVTSIIRDLMAGSVA